MPLPAAREPAIRSFVSRYFALELEKQSVGFLKSVEGGNVKAEVVAQQTGGMPLKAKHIGLPQIDPINIQVGMSMTAKPFWEWIKNAWAGQIIRKDGSVQAADHKMNIVFENEFSQALITETTIPAMDGGSKEPFYMGVKFLPEKVKQSVGGGRKINVQSETTPQKKWIPSMFRLEIDGLDCTHVNKIDSFTVKQGTKKLEIGPKREYELEPTNLEFPNLSVTLALSTARTWLDWHKSFVIDGNNTTDQERGGHIWVMTSNRKNLLHITLKQLGIYNLVADKADAGSDSIRRMKAELYCEEMAFEYLG